LRFAVVVGCRCCSWLFFSVGFLNKTMTHQNLNNYLQQQRLAGPWAIRAARQDREDDAGPNRGWGDMPEQPTQREIDDNRYWDRLRYGDDWAEYWMELDDVNEYDEAVTRWALKDETERYYYDRKQRKIDAYKDAVRWRRLARNKEDYDRRIEEIQREGIRGVRLTPQRTNNMYSIRVEFPRGFEHTILPAAVARKMNTDASFHITVTYQGEMDGNMDLTREIHAWRHRWFPPGEQGIVVDFPEAWVSSKGVFMLGGDREFDRELRRITQLGSGRDPHISME